ncbi:hypothetical protein KD930_gp44 [Mycobacterium phage Kevin1]|uniref:Uncharacterized protein n=1 Tax=Mycobacterium phage Kevin1 TaxID=2530132 RepID=A0A481VUC3_9CAUD|nr:hypothetical protein KD930_gp44 [Mycobacterium phage Kevin1]QBI97288.1 hypothetical protein SEA_KEVIN1_44 [Mycobacterium phage Kevin1]
MSIITISRDVSTSGIGRIKAVAENFTLAMAIEVDLTPYGGDRYWQLAVVHAPINMSEPKTYPRIDDEAAAEQWVRFLGEMVLRAERAEAVTR